MLFTMDFFFSFMKSIMWKWSEYLELEWIFRGISLADVWLVWMFLLIQEHNYTSFIFTCVCEICAGDHTWQEVMWWDGGEPTTRTPESHWWTASWGWGRWGWWFPEKTRWFWNEKDAEWTYSNWNIIFTIIRLQHQLKLKNWNGYFNTQQ